jgi:hypothetical protein
MRDHMIISAMVAVGKENVIGKDKLLWCFQLS